MLLTNDLFDIRIKNTINTFNHYLYQILCHNINTIPIGGINDMFRRYFIVYEYLIINHYFGWNGSLLRKTINQCRVMFIKLFV